MTQYRHGMEVNYLGKMIYTFAPVANIIKLFWHNLCHKRHKISKILTESMPIAT
jgi:hypothetical protein